jgi:hypothetical protein
MVHPELTEENRLFREAIREFARREVAPLVAEAEETNTATEGTSEVQRLVIAREEGYEKYGGKVGNAPLKSRRSQIFSRRGGGQRPNLGPDRRRSFPR